MVVLPPQELPVAQVRTNLFKLAEVKTHPPTHPSSPAPHSNRLALLYLPITHPPTHPPTQKAFKQEETVTGMEVIAKARVPIIKLRFHNLQVNHPPTHPPTHLLTYLPTHRTPISQ